MKLGYKIDEHGSLQICVAETGEAIEGVENFAVEAGAIDEPHTITMSVHAYNLVGEVLTG